jgi:putative oxidoreductase
MHKNPDLALLIVRLILAGILLSHGIAKVTHWPGMLGFFTSANIPLPTVSLAFATLAEVGGGVLIVLGLWIEIAAAMVMIDMVGAIVFVVKGSAFDLGQGGTELIIFALALALLLGGAGRYSIGRRAVAL